MKALPWSHSSLENFKNCPKQYYHLKVVKDVKDSPGEAAMWGDMVHKQFEAYLKGEIALPETLANYQSLLSQTQALPGVLYPEQQLALNKDMQPCGWFDSDVWVRGIVDVLVIDGERAVVLDWKTGKNRKPSSRQLQLFALLVFAHYPTVRVCKTSFLWLKFLSSGDFVDTEIFHRDQVAGLWQTFLPDLKMFVQAFKTETFTPKESGLCRGWCPVNSCKFWKPKR